MIKKNLFFIYNKKLLIFLIKKIKILLKNINLNNKFKIFTNSLSIEDSILLDIIISYNLKIHTYTINTNKLFKFSTNIININKYIYNYNISNIKINIKLIKKYLILNYEKNFNKIYKKRKKCCYIRKIKLIDNILKFTKYWITGQCEFQSLTRKNLKIIQYINNNNIIKLNPIKKFSIINIWNYVNINKIFYNKLYKKNYLSIGCHLCTKNNIENENIRFGRWWWENKNQKECGLHKIK